MNHMAIRAHPFRLIEKSAIKTISISNEKSKKKVTRIAQQLQTWTKFHNKYQEALVYSEET